MARLERFNGNKFGVGLSKLVHVSSQMNYRLEEARNTTGAFSNTIFFKKDMGQEFPRKKKSRFSSHFQEYT